MKTGAASSTSTRNAAGSRVSGNSSPFAACTVMIEIASGRQKSGAGMPAESSLMPEAGTDVTVPTINVHLKNIYESGELTRDATIRKYLTVQIEGDREVSRTLDYYNLDAIISVGYRVNSRRATQFRQWATRVLTEFAVKGYVLDKKRMENGTFLGEDYFERLLAEIREIRLSERRFYQKITDIYATSLDYNRNAPTTREFFANVQNKLHFAIHGNTAAELIMARADSRKKHMGLSTWEKAPDGKILKPTYRLRKTI